MPETASSVTHPTQSLQMIIAPSMAVGESAFIRTPDGSIYRVRVTEGQQSMAYCGESSPMFASLLGRQLSTDLGKPDEQGNQQIQTELALAQKDDFKKYENYEIDGVISGETPERMPTMHELLSGVDGQAITNKPLDAMGKVHEEEHSDSPSNDKAADIEVYEEAQRDNSSDEETLPQFIGTSSDRSSYKKASVEPTKRALDTSDSEEGVPATPVKISKIAVLE